ncbi:MAG: SsrA-binding protein [Chlamydiae bacterium CG10_big_fil_rev_8_21_14_0_10_42_34]|nr:MAG: SsrA-binding protein [Chlamydiae bacterium CG10_big_fil_rev_8_21_14_0_10_42_34]
MSKDAPKSELVSNRRATYDYEILDTFEAGIILLGSEIKSLRNHGGSLQDAYVDVRGKDLTLLNCSIAPYSHGGVFNHEERRPKKLLMHKREIEKLKRLVHEKGLAVIPLSIYLNKKGIAKVRIATAKGKKAYDKRAALKEKDDKRSIQRALDE